MKVVCEACEAGEHHLCSEYLAVTSALPLPISGQQLKTQRTYRSGDKKLVIRWDSPDRCDCGWWDHEPP